MSQILQQQLRALADPHRATLHLRFFKTAPGQYGHGDKFLGITATPLRQLAKQNRQLKLSDNKVLLQSEFHEERYVALVILTMQYEKADEAQRGKIVRFYLTHKKHINNWDLVDVSCYKILGQHLLNQNDRSQLYRLAKSKSLWDRRIAVISTLAFIKDGQFSDTLDLAELLLKDEEDLMHKAVGWMLREVGKRSSQQLEKFLQQHLPNMPRTMLRYAIEKLPQSKRRLYLEKNK